MSSVQRLALPPTLTMDEAAAAARDVAAALRGGTGVLEVDASAVDTLDTGAVALLLQAQREARTRGRELRLAGAPEKLLALARLYGVEGLLPKAGGGGAGSGSGSTTAPRSA